MLVLCGSGLATLMASSSATAVARGTTQAAGPRPREFWTAILANGRAVPDGHAPIDLLIELGAHFGHADPVLRDQCGYGITARWVVTEKRLSNAELQRLATAWLPGLMADRDPAGGDAVLYRSFSALGLSLVVAADLQHRALNAATIEGLVARAAQQLRTNVDHRGYVAPIGWVHVTAHTADLLKFLGRHPLLTATQQRRILDSVSAAVAAAPGVFQWGEDERLSRAAASVLRRDDADAAAIAAFLDAVQGAGSRVDWDQPLANGGLAPLLNAKAVLRDLHLVLSVAGKDQARAQVLQRLEGMP